MSECGTYKDEHGLNRDAVEKSTEFLAIQKELAVKVKKATKKMGIKPGALGYCHRYWAIQKHILKNDYGIDWKSPQELNAWIMFD